MQRKSFDLFYRDLQTVCIVDTAENISNGILSIAEGFNARGIVMGLDRKKYAVQFAPSLA